MRARRWWGWPLAPIYAAGLAVRDGLRRLGVLRVRRLVWPVISVGSLSAGGAGKTPVVIALAELLRGRGWSVDVLSRGYSRTGRGVERVDLDAADAAARFGDEPVVIAQRAGVPVWVGAERFAAGAAAENYAASEREAGSSFEKFRVQREADSSSFDNVRKREADSSAALRNDKEDALRNDKEDALWNDKEDALRNDDSTAETAAPVRRVHLLDDGFQHWGLTRTVDVVLVTEEDFEDALLPAGNRREPLAGLVRADAVVLRERERERVEARVRGLMRAGSVLWSVRRELRFAEGGAGERPLAFCAIARAEGFFAMLQEAGCKLVERVAFGDHHAYAMADMERMVAMARQCAATGFLTTEKDAVKLTDAMLQRLRSVGPVSVVGLEARFVDEGDVVRELEERVR
jgi:tetraacyldisaccharide 4'-kinase